MRIEDRIYTALKRYLFLLHNHILNNMRIEDRIYTGLKLFYSVLKKNLNLNEN